MEITLTEAIGIFGIIVSIIAGIWVIANRFGSIDARFGAIEGRLDNLEYRVGKIEEKLDEILSYIRPKKKRRKIKLYHKK